MRVDEIGGHGRCFSPGGKSLVMAGMLGAKNTSHVSDSVLVVRRDLEELLSDCPCLERASARIGQGEAVTRAVPRAFDRSSRLEVIMAFANRISKLLFSSNRLAPQHYYFCGEGPFSTH